MNPNRFNVFTTFNEIYNAIIYSNRFDLDDSRRDCMNLVSNQQINGLNMLNQQLNNIIAYKDDFDRLFDLNTLCYNDVNYVLNQNQLNDMVGCINQLLNCIYNETNFMINNYNNINNNP